MEAERTEPSSVLVNERTDPLLRSSAALPEAYGSFRMYWLLSLESPSISFGINRDVANMDFGMYWFEILERSDVVLSVVVVKDGYFSCS